MSEPLPMEHVLTHVRDALAADERVGELGLDASAEGDVVVVRGAVSTERRKAGVLPLVHEVLHAHGCDRTVRDDTVVTAARVPADEPEAL